MQDNKSCPNQVGRDSAPDGDTFFLLWRSILDKPHFSDPNLLKVWVWCLAKASYKPRCLQVRTGRGSTTVNIQRGQFLFGRKAAADELQMPEGSVRDRMKKLQELESIDIQPDTHFSIVSVVNFDLYQPPTGKHRQATRQPNDNQEPGKRQASTTNNEGTKGNRGERYTTSDGDGAMCDLQEKSRELSSLIKRIDRTIHCRTDKDKSLCVKVARLVCEGQLSSDDVEQAIESTKLKKPGKCAAWFHDCCANKAKKYGANFLQMLASIDVDQAGIDSIYQAAIMEGKQ